MDNTSKNEITVVNTLGILVLTNDLSKEIAENWKQKPRGKTFLSVAKIQKTKSLGWPVI